MKISRSRWGLCAAVLWCSACATAPTRTQIDFDDSRDSRLANGMRVIVLEDHRAPLVTVAMMVNAGAVNDRPGRTGFAHLFEHLMFQGSANVDAGQHLRILGSQGGTGNATTSTEYTYYFDSVPANQLELSLFLNSDRLRSLAITAENFAREKEVVKEEKRMRVDNQPYRKSGAVLDELLYDSFAYGHDSVMADLDAASLDDIQDFFDTYYAANNITLVLAGDVEPGAARALVEKYFADLPQRAPPPAVEFSEPPQEQSRRQGVADALAPAARVSLAFKTVPIGHADYYPLRVLAAVLAEGHSARLYQALVQTGMASSINGSLDDLRGPSGLSMSADVREKSSAQKVEQTIYDEIERVQQDGIEDWELQKGQSAATVEILNSLRRSVTRGLYVARSALFFDDPGRASTDLELINAVTAADVQRVAREHLREVNRTVVITLPVSK